MHSSDNVRKNIKNTLLLKGANSSLPGSRKNHFLPALWKNPHSAAVQRRQCVFEYAARPSESVKLSTRLVG